MGRGRKGRTEFAESAWNNNLSFLQYVEQLTELSVSSFEWSGLPDTVDDRYIELMLFESGAVVYFRDEDLGGDLCLNMIQSGNFDVYGYPILRRAYSRYNNYSKLLKPNNSVIIWNNYIRTNSILTVRQFARKLWNIDRIIEVNVNAQKTPVLVQGTEQQRLTLLNVYKEYEGNAPVIYGDKNLDINGIKVLTTNAPYVSDKLYELKTKIWNEALTYLGISNITVNKKERLITDEVNRNMGGVLANRNSRLNQRQRACEKINKMFGTDIWVEWKEVDVDNSKGEVTEIREDVEV